MFLILLQVVSSYIIVNVWLFPVSDVNGLLI